MLYDFAVVLGTAPSCSVKLDSSPGGPELLTGLLVWASLVCSSAGKESACNEGDLGSIPGLGRSSGEGNGYHSSILAWRIWDCKVLDTTEQLSLSYTTCSVSQILTKYLFHCIL